MISAHSGEIFFHANAIAQYGKRTLPDISQDFWEFLEKNVSSGESDEAQSLTSEAQLTRSAITITLETYLLKLRYRIQAIQKALELQRRKNTAEVKLMQVRVNERLISYHRHCEAEMMRLILQYNAIIQRELKDSKRMLGDEYEEKLLQRKQVKILRDIRLFANHLMMESRGKISFAMLNADSQQFSRCIKAVLDNVNAARGLFAGESDLNNRVRVLNVFKLQNTHISNKLQATSEKVSNGKIKGLFCCLSKESFYNFSVFGLHAQALPGRSPDDLSKLADNWLGTVWFHAEPPPGVPVTPEAAYVLKSAGTAAKLSQHRSRQLSPRSGADARIYAASPHILHFSRYSTISDIARFTEEQLNEGIFLSLCRVLVVKQKTIAKDIEDADIIEAVQEQYDCLYSTLR